MEIVFGVIFGGIFGALVSIILMLERISKTLKSNSESLSKIAKHFEQIEEKEEN
jgi:uncharacterized membrane protein YqgA involved in biofilm formation